MFNKEDPTFPSWSIFMFGLWIGLLVGFFVTSFSNHNEMEELKERIQLLKEQKESLNECYEKLIHYVIKKKIL